MLFVSTENSAGIDVKPRLAAAGAIMPRCHLISDHVLLPDDVDRIRALANRSSNVALIVIDPVANHIGNNNSNSEAEVRHAIGPLNKLADDLDTLIVGVRHLGKDRTRGAPASILGSTAWIDVPRAVVMVAKDDQAGADGSTIQLRHIEVVAGNRTPTGAGLSFRIDVVPVAGADGEITVAIDLGSSERRVEDFYSGKTSAAAPDTTDRNMELQHAILEALETGPLTREQIDKICTDQYRISKNVVWQAGLTPLRDSDQITSYKGGFDDVWYYELKARES